MSERIKLLIHTRELLAVARGTTATNTSEITSTQSFIETLKRTNGYISLPKTGASLRKYMGITGSSEQNKSEVSTTNQQNGEDTEKRRDNPSSSDILELYYRELKHPLLTRAQEIDLAKKSEDSRQAFKQLHTDPELSPEDKSRLAEIVTLGHDARQRLIESNLRLVVKVAQKYQGRGLELPDLIQEGSTGLMRGIEKYDWRKGFRVSTYVYWWIRQSVSRAIAEQGHIIRKPVHISELATKVYRAYEELTQQLGTEPDAQNLADHLDIPKSKIYSVTTAYSEPISLDTPTGKDDSGTISDFVSEPDAEADIYRNAENHALRIRLEQAFIEAGLTPRESSALRLRFGIDDNQQDRTLNEVGDELGVSRERVRQLEAEAMRKLRQPKLRSTLAEFLS